MTNKRMLMICLAILAGISLQAQPQRGMIREKANYELAARFSRKKVDKMVFSTSVSPTGSKPRTFSGMHTKPPPEKHGTLWIRQKEHKGNFLTG